MVNSKNLNGKLKLMPNILWNIWQAVAIPAIEESNEDLIEKIREVVGEELQYHQEKVSQIIKSQLRSTNERLKKTSQKILDISNSLKLIPQPPPPTHTHTASKKKIVDGIKQVPTNLQDVMYKKCIRNWR